MNVVAVLAVQRDGYGAEVSKEAQHLVVRRVVRDEEAQVRIAQDCSDANESRSATGDNANILPRVLRGLALAMVGVVHLRHGFTHGLDAAGGTVFAATDGDVNVRGAVFDALDACTLF